MAKIGFGVRSRVILIGPGRQMALELIPSVFDAVEVRDLCRSGYVFPQQNVLNVSEWTLGALAPSNTLIVEVVCHVD